MAVMYSKLGGCLGVTAKLGPLARTDLCAGVKGLLERLMTHLGLGSSLEEPWLDLGGGVEVGLPSLEVAQASREGWSGCCLGECLVPCLLALGGLLLCPAWGALEDWGLLVTGGEVAWEELFSSLAGMEPDWGGELPASEGRCTAPGRELLPSLGGRWAIASVWLREGPWLLVWLFIELIVILLMLLAWLLRVLLPSGERWTVAGGELSPSPGGRRAVAGVGLRELGGVWTCLFINLTYPIYGIGYYLILKV